LPRTAQPKVGQAKLHRGGTSADDRAAILGEQRHGPWTPGVFVEYLDRLAPGGGLRGVDLAEIQHVSLHRAATRNALALDNRPVAVDLAVLLPLGASQEHRETTLCTASGEGEQGRSSPQRLSPKLKTSSLGDQPLTTSKKVKIDLFDFESAKTG